MALKAEVPLLDYIEVSLKCKREEEKMVAKPLVPVPDPVIQGGANKGAVGRVEQAVPNLMAGEGQAKPGSSWREEYLIAKSSTNGRLVCMVCGGILSASGPAAAREHILQHHAHSMDFSPEEKQNILEAWSEGQTLTDGEMQTYLEDNPGKREQPAEIDVLLDPEEQPANRKPGQPKARCETVRSDPGQRSQGQRRVRSSDGAKDVRSDQPGQVTGKEWPSECGVPGSAPAEIRIFTDGSFPAGFALKLYCRTPPEVPQDTGAKATAKKRMGDKPYRDCSVSLLRLHSTDSPHCLGLAKSNAPRPFGNSLARGNVKDCGVKLGQRKAMEVKARDSLPPNPQESSLDSCSAQPKLLMDFDAITVRLGVYGLGENASCSQVCSGKHTGQAAHPSVPC
ncbi:spindlin interactor and repressor of chromatin-binding protein isoform X2 [Sphaerodactylus townsendi]|uniref:spindlin interactor and repressor of chromatin-binding protein isoform X2 n=2 Tax=Sphaerodactylus townsendi TaxID=933632 RepID=UPI0020272327|nr:spindlin interactor and repressor of chromatin-binding protein isoform X2 [Sphaerodactylus townsendi]XP_048367906.1 spindlin interactor and repressor of chromatin-binding protein isoform X2 [Sphaerodactylus townsendi]XP_048367915.1 spindlin interactor and repressor of chromatin-binding protein isoform X2 [Sphaerodactylus townsendi]